MLKPTVPVSSAPMLVIESIPLVAPLLRETAGADTSLIQVAANGAEALALLRNFAPQLVLADMALTDMSGFSS